MTSSPALPFEPLWVEGPGLCLASVLVSCDMAIVASQIAMLHSENIYSSHLVTVMLYRRQYIRYV